ncbi:hypothetical protein [Streptomyces sp. NPDC059452]|uniref:hypothetical protein n=1 Tax=Streptomyces sp. NPDC059452 TaxID=3346835 RepID=UPI003692A7BC
MTTERSPQRADGWTAAVRQRLGLGRLLPLGGPEDAAWIAETAAASVLRGAAGPGAVLGTLRIGPAREASGTGTWPGGPAGARAGAAAGPALPPVPPSGLPPGPLRIEAEFRAAGDRPLPDSAAALRTALVTAAAARLGLEVAEVDLRVTALLDDGASEQVTAPPEAASSAPAPSVPVAKADGPAGEAASAVPGVVSLTRVLGSAVHTAEDHIRIEVATAGDHRALDVARSVRTAVSAATADRLPVSVLVTEVVERGAGGRSVGR